jgi:hypothetical protein
MSLTTQNAALMNLTSIVADTSGNVIGISDSDTALKLYCSPSYGQLSLVSTVDVGDIAPRNGSVYTLEPSKIAATPDFSKVLVSCIAIPPSGSIQHSALYLLDASGVFPNYTPTKMPFYDASDNELTIGAGTVGTNDRVTALAVDASGVNMYAGYDNGTSINLYKYSSTLSGFQLINAISPSALACSSDGISLFVLIPGDLYYFPIVSTRLSYQLTTTAFGKPSYSPINAIACNAAATILYAIDIDTLYVFNTSTWDRSMQPEDTWTTLPITIDGTPMVGTLRAVTCDPTGVHIIVSAVNSATYFSDDSGVTWQVDNAIDVDLSPILIVSPTAYKQFIYYYADSNAYSGIYERMSISVNYGSASFLSTFDPTTVLTNSDGSEILAVNTAGSLCYSSNYANSFTEITNSNVADTRVILHIAASSDFTVILVEMDNFALNFLTISGSTYTLTPVTYASGVTAPTLETFIAVSPDGLNKAAVADNNNATYDLWYSINNGAFNYLGTVDTILTSPPARATSVKCSNTDTPFFYVCVSNGKFDQYDSSGSNPLGYNIAASSGRVLGATPTSLVRSTVPSPVTVPLLNSIATDTTGRYVFVSGLAAGGGVSFSTNFGTNFSLLVSIPSDSIASIACNSSATLLMIHGNNGVYFVDVDLGGGGTPSIGPIKFLSNTNVTAIASNANGAHQYFYDPNNGIYTRNATGLATPCFLEGTKILCLLSGLETYLAVETLRPGTLVKTPSGFKKVDKIGKSSILNPGHSGRTMDHLYVCRKENFPELTEDLYITGYHSILVDELTDNEQKRTLEINGRVFEASGKKCLMASVCEKTEPWAQEGTFTIWHFSLEDEDEKSKFGVYSNGLLTETCSVEYMDTSSLHTRLESVSQVPKHFFNKSLICKRKSG